MLTWKIPLGLPPQIALTAYAQHGRQAVETYRLPHLWCVHLYEYDAELLLNGVPLQIRPGHASVVPPDTEMEYRFRGISPHIYAHFSPPNAGRQDLVTIPAMQDLGKEFAPMHRMFADIPRWVRTHPRRAVARLWEMLWRLAEQAPAPPVAANPATAVERVRELVEIHLAEPLYVANLAQQVGFSQNHLTRLFRAAQGITVVEYIRQRRVERARHLLQNSTLPVKAIAAEVGIADLHLFNKVIRRALGKPPREIR